MQLFIICASCGVLCLLGVLCICALLFIRAHRRAEGFQSESSAQSVSVVSGIEQLSKSIAVGLAENASISQRVCQSVELAIKTNAQAANIATKALRDAIEHLRGVLAENRQQAQAISDQASTQMVSDLDRLNSAVVDHAKKADEHFARQQSTFMDGITSATKETSQQLLRAGDTMRKVIADFNEAAQSAITNLTASQEAVSARGNQLLERFQIVLGKAAEASSKHIAQQGDLIESAGKQLSDVFNTGFQEFGRLAKEQEERLAKQRSSLHGEVATFAEALEDLKKSLEEAVRF